MRLLLLLLALAGRAVATRIAAVGDYGDDNRAAAAVAKLIRGWDEAARLDAVVSLGDNNYWSGSADKLRAHIGQHYGWAIGADKADNRFWPVPGNHVGFVSS